MDGEDHRHQPLITINENEVTKFDGQDHQVSRYPVITNKILLADESFLYASHGSLAEPDGAQHGRRAATMQNIHEKASFLNLTNDFHFGKMLHKALMHFHEDVTFGSVAGLNTAVVDRPDGLDGLLTEGEEVGVLRSNRHTKNLLVVSFTVTLMFIALGSVRNLQSSMNHEGGVGVISMAVSFAGYMLGSVFSVTLVQTFQPRSCLIVAVVPHLLYVAANFYPVMGLMVPVSFVQGVALAVLWNAMSTYVTLLARGRAREQNEKFAVVSARFFGIFGFIFQSYFIIGNLISSLVLSFGSQPPATPTRNSSLLSAHNSSALTTKESPILTNDSTAINTSVLNEAPHYIPDLESRDNTTPAGHLHLCGADFWQHYDLGSGAYSIKDETKYLLLGIYMGCVLASILIAVFLLEKLNPKVFASPLPPLTRMRSQLWSLVTFSIQARFLLILPMLVYSFMQIGFVTAEITKAYVTCALGIHMVGYTMMCLGVCGSIMCYISGFLTKFIGRMPQIIAAAVMNLGVLTHMIFWKPSPDSVLPFFIDLGIWGAGDGIWVSQINSLLSVVFPDKYEEAFAGLRVAQGFGVAIVFAYSNSLGMLSKIYITGVVCVVSVAGYLLMERALKRDKPRAGKVLRETAI
ncbi:unnamed protein product [Lymnaea stagnalis]|uniref:UNC93-like protein n=1 Tax=Lymnaea stagnalis TaxID=6523 RepID=A0AAV2HTJ8_LYMST